MRADPFELKRLPKWHPSRVAFTIQARLLDRLSRWSYDSSELPTKSFVEEVSIDDADRKDTAVTPRQMGHLVAALTASESVAGSVCVEVGCYRGVTTKLLAARTGRTYVAVDPYIGYGGCDGDYEVFKRNTAGLKNLVHMRMTSGQAARDWRHPRAGLVFIDAVHDYVNTSFDIHAWFAHMAPGGIMALHDTDNLVFAGTRRAAFEASEQMDLWAHVDNLVILRRAT